MGAKTCILAHADGDARQALSTMPAPDEAATASFVASLLPDRRFTAPTAADLSCTYVSDDGIVVAGCFPALRIAVTTQVAMDRPSEMPPQYIAAKGTTIVHAMHSVVDWFAFAVWEDGVLRRSLSVAPDEGVIEDIGNQFAFEIPYWSGAHPAIDPDDDEPNGYPLPFHPLELGEAALREFFGFQIEGYVDPSLLEAERIGMFKFDAQGKPAGTGKPWWKFW